MNRAKDLPQVLDTAFNENHKRLNIVREYQNKMLYKLDGKASERVRDSILNHFKN